MVKAKVLFDFLTVLLVLLGISLIFFFKLLFWITVVYIIFYSIIIIVLGIRKSKKFSHGLAIFIGSIVLPGILPLIYYLTYLRKFFKEPKLVGIQHLQQEPSQQPQQPVS